MSFFVRSPELHKGLLLVANVIWLDGIAFVDLPAVNESHRPVCMLQGLPLCKTGGFGDHPLLRLLVANLIGVKIELKVLSLYFLLELLPLLLSGVK
jgi:hypothetical protein